MKKIIIIVLLLLLLFTSFVSSIGYATPSIISFYLEMTADDDQLYEIVYDVEDEEYTYMRPNVEQLEGTEAKKTVESFVFNLGLTTDMSERTVKEKVLTTLEVGESTVSDINLKVTFDGGKDIAVDE